VPVDAAAVQRLVATAARRDGADTVLWTSGDSEILVEVGGVKTELNDGLLLVTIPVRCEQAPSAHVQVAFAVGSDERPAGMVAATEERPRGPAVVIDIWGDALVAFAWQLVLAVTTALARESGKDIDGAGLVPAGVTVSADGLRILTMARHEFDRVTQ
jgi:hypothetical protein